MKNQPRAQSSGALDSTALKTGPTADDRTSALGSKGGKTGRDSYQATQFTVDKERGRRLRRGDMTPVQEEGASWMLATDDQGNRTSILPNKERPDPPSTRKKKSQESKKIKEFDDEDIKE